MGPSGTSLLGSGSTGSDPVPVPCSFHAIDSKGAASRLRLSSRPARTASGPCSSSSWCSPGRVDARGNCRCTSSRGSRPGCARRPRVRRRPARRSGWVATVPTPPGRPLRGSRARKVTWWRDGLAPALAYGLERPTRWSSGTVRSSTAGESPKSEASWASMADATFFSLFDEVAEEHVPGLDVGAHVAVAQGVEGRPQVGHGEAAVAGHVHAAQEGDVVGHQRFNLDPGCIGPGPRHPSRSQPACPAIDPERR